MNPEILPYESLIRAFVERRLTGREFESIYLRLFKNESTFFPHEVFQVLNALFSNVDAFTADDAIRGPDDIDEQTLRREAASALDDLRRLATELEADI